MKKAIFSILFALIMFVSFYIMIPRCDVFDLVIYTIFICVTIYGLKCIRVKFVLEKGEWRTAFVEKCYRCSFDKDYYNVSIKLEDEANLKKKCILGDDTLKTLKSGNKIRVLVNKKYFLFEEDIELYSSVIFLKKYTERHKSELKMD